MSGGNRACGHETCYRTAWIAGVAGNVPGERAEGKWLADTRRAIKLPAMREVLETATQGARSINILQSEVGNPAGDAGAESFDSIHVHRFRGIGNLAVAFIPPASCGLHSNGGDADNFHHSSGTTSKVMRRRGGRRFNYGATRRRIHRLVVPSLVGWAKTSDA